jgi:hypothetical protein
MVRSIAAAAATAILFAVGACDQPGQTERQRESTANEQAANSQNSTEQRALNAQAEADKQVASARADFEKSRENYMHGRRLDLVSLDTNVMDLEAKAHTMSGKPRADLDARITNILSRRATYVGHMTTLETEGAANWDAAKTNLDREWDSLKSEVDHTND